MKRQWIIGLSVLLSFVFVLSYSGTAYAIDNPDDTPSVEDIYAWRNVLETGDMLVILVENTPYTTTPTDYTYPQAFIWRFVDSDDNVLGVSVGYAYNEDGYGYNVIGFYWDETEAPAWAGNYTLTLSETASAFATPLEWNYPVSAAAYSALTDTDEVKADIADMVIGIAQDFYSYWSLTSVTTLLAETETGTVLSIAGQTFFRGSVYGIQGMAPAAFPIDISSFDLESRTWTDAYVTTLEAQHAGNIIESSFDAGEDLLDVDYNLMGLLIALFIGAGLIFANWILAGGQVWKGALEAIPVLVIGTRMALVGLGELGLIAAICMLYVNARLWKIV